MPWNRNTTISFWTTIAVATSVVAAISYYSIPNNSVPWWKSVKYQLLHSSKDATLMEKLERISIAADACQEASRSYKLEVERNQDSISSDTKKKLKEASSDIDYLFSVLDNEEFSSGIVDLKNKRKELVNKCNQIAKEIDMLLIRMGSNDGNQ